MAVRVRVPSSAPAKKVTTKVVTFFAGFPYSPEKRQSFFSTPFLLIAYKRNGVEPPKKIRQRGAPKPFGFSPLTEENSLSKTLPFYFRCRCSGADLRYWCSLAPPQPHANLLCRRQSMAVPAITTTIGAAAIISGFTCPVTPCRSIERCTLSLLPRKNGVLRGKTLECRTRPSAFGADRVFPLSDSLPTFCSHRK